MTDTAGSKVDRAIAALVARIGNGLLVPGQRLPPEQALADDLDVSRLSLREAVRALASSGVLEVRRGAGTFVSDLRPERLLGPLATFLDLVDGDGIAELFECRKIIEPGGTALAATRIDDAGLGRLQEHVDRMAGLRDPEELVAEDLAFHADIVAASGNATLTSLSTSVAQRTARARIWRAAVELDVLAWTHDQHVAILRALRSGDAQAAWVAATTHVTEVERWVTDRLTAPRPGGAIMDG